MKVIKFRIWHREFSCWISQTHGKVKHSNDLVCCDGVYMLAMSGVFNKYDIEQYTGLKDKNGKEIYEGDIVKYARSKLESVESPKGVFSNRLIELGEDIGEIAFIEFQYVVSFNHKRSDDIEKLGYYPHRFEVIGNIHENPELLEEKK